MFYRLNLRKLSIWIILTLQLLLISSYFYMQPSESSINQGAVSFLISTDNATDNKTTYHTLLSKVRLKQLTTRHLFEDFNSSLCYKNGTDIKLMHRSHKSWKCECFPGYHGADCGQPEVIWRALLANRKVIQLRGPRKVARSIVYIFEVNKITKTITDIRVNELNATVDLFVLYEIGSDFIATQMNNGFLKGYHKKILYIKTGGLKKVWHLAKKVIGGLKSDDIVLFTGYHEIPNTAALLYFKLYDNWPEPVSFRLRWSVYGFFWIHPNRTNLQTLAFSVRYLYEVMNNDLSNVRESSKGFNVGDLNHFGGWFCEYCNEPGRIIAELNVHPASNPVVFNSNKKSVDENYVEELIENGLYLDGKTELLRAHRFHETYFAPKFLVDNNWKYDYLMINIYSKMDYYE